MQKKSAESNPNPDSNLQIPGGRFSDGKLKLGEKGSEQAKGWDQAPEDMRADWGEGIQPLPFLSPQEEDMIIADLNIEHLLCYVLC